MYTNITEHCKEVIKRSSRTFAASFVINGIRYSDIKSSKVSVPSASNGKITIGGTLSNHVEIVTSKVGIMEGMTINVYESIKLDSGEYEDVPMGKYTIYSAITKDDFTTIKANGPLSNATLGYFSELNYPASTIEILNEISALIETTIEVDNLEEIYVETKPEGYTIREVIGYVAALHGMNAVETRNGNIAFKWYEHSEEDILTDKTDSPELSNNLFTVERFECVTGDTTIIRGGGYTGISINNPLMTEEIADLVWGKLSGFCYRPGTFNIKSGTPCVDPWDSFTYNEETIIATELDYTHDGGLQNEYKSVGESETSSASKGPMALAMERYYAELVLIKEAMVDSLTVKEADIRYLQASSIDTITLNVEQAVVKNLEADFADVTLANIDIANIDKSSIGLLFAEVGLITDATIKDGHITGFLDAVEVNANNVTAGTLSVDRLIFRGDENSIIYELNNITGALQAVQGDTLNGEILTDRSITVDKIVANSITANEIAAGTITASELATNAVTTAKISAGAITTDKISANSITSLKIATDALKSRNYVADSTGSFLNLADGSFSSKNLRWDSDGKLSATDVSLTGDIYCANGLWLPYHERDASGAVPGEFFEAIRVGCAADLSCIEASNCQWNFGYVEVYNELTVEEKIRCHGSMNVSDVITSSGMGCGTLQADEIYADSIDCAGDIWANTIRTKSGISLGDLKNAVYGSNANGKYYKFWDGTLICTKVVTFNATLTSQWGSMFESGYHQLGNWAYPGGFKEVPTVHAMSAFATESGSTCFVEGIWSLSTTSAGKCYICRPVSTAAAAYSIHVIGIGRWK